MAKKKSRKRREAIPRVMITIRVTSEWREWLANLAKFHRSRPTDIIDRALVKFAEDTEFPLKAPER